MRISRLAGVPLSATSFGPHGEVRYNDIRARSSIRAHHFHWPALQAVCFCAGPVVDFDVVELYSGASYWGHATPVLIDVE